MSLPFVVLLGVTTALRVPGPLSPRIASYAIDARLDDAAHEVHGTARLTWHNPGSVPVQKVPLHLYMNAFKNERSTYLHELRWSKEPLEVKPGRWGFCRVDAVTARVGAEAIAATIVVDPGEETLAEVTLARPIAPGETLSLDTTFTTRLPQIISRAGADGGFFAVAQWFPKIGAYVCDPTCGFRADAYHSDSEFFADFGTYDVTLDLPRTLVVGATGVRADEKTNGARQTLVYHAEDVHDFAWAADARFVSRVEQIDDGLGEPVTVRILSAPGTARHAMRHLAAVRAGLVELGQRLGPYPYRELTVVSPPPGGEEAQGMEYPTFFFTEDDPAPESVRLPELVTAHELAHQWFQGMLASDEVNQPWLDEGLAELATGWVLRRMFPPRGAFYELLGHRMDYRRGEQSELLDEHADPVVTPSQGFRDRASYSHEVYRKAALLVATLEDQLGEEAFRRDLRRYADRARFSHPRAEDFIAAFEDAPPALRTLLTEGLYHAATLDYAITAAASTPVRKAAGLFSVDGGVREDEGSDMQGHVSEIVVERRGELRAPIVVRARFADGTVVDRALPAEAADASRWRRIELESTSAMMSAELYPNDDVPLDCRRWNDALRVEPDARPRRALVTSLRVLTAIALGWIAR
jgi:hypothetical protein